MINPFLFEQKNGLNKKDQPGPDDCNRPDLGSRPGSAVASFRARMMDNTRFYKGFCDFKGSSWTLRSCQSWAPRNKFNAIDIDCRSIFCSNKNGLNKKDKPGPDGRNRPDLGPKAQKSQFLRILINN